MATLEQLQDGLRKAHAAGNADHARAFANAIRQMQSGSQPSGNGGVVRTPQQWADAENLPIPGTEWNTPEPVNAQPAITPMSAAQGGAMQGMTFGFNDEIMAGMMTPIEMGIDAFQGKDFDIGRSFTQALEKTRATEAQMQEEQPIAHTIGNIAGGIGTGVGLSNAGLTLMRGAAPTVTSMGTRGAIEGMLYGGLHGLGTGTDDKIGSGVSGALVGGALGGVVGGISGAVANNAARAAVPTVDDLKAQAGGLYDSAKNSGVTFPQASVQTVADDIAAKAITEGIDPTLHPGATAAVKRLQDASNTGMTVQDAQTMRRVLAAAAKDPTNPDQARIASMLVGDFDDFVGQSVPQLGQANKVYAQAKKAELLETAIQKAHDAVGANYTSAGLATAIRQQFRSILHNPRLIRGFSESEVEAIRKVVAGGGIENALRLVGKMAPTGNISAAGTLGTPTILGMAMGNPGAGAMVGVGAAGVGTAARHAANRMTENSARDAIVRILTGGQGLSHANRVVAPVAQGLIAAGGAVAPAAPVPRAFALN